MVSCLSILQVALSMEHITIQDRPILALMAVTSVSVLETT